MKYIKTFENVKNPTYYYKIPVYPLEKYFLALHKVGMSPEQYKNWSTNTSAQYWNNSSDYFKFIYLMKQYNVHDKNYYFAWTDSHASTINADAVIEITVEDYEINANKYNL